VSSLLGGWNEIMNFTVYTLHSPQYDKIYIGYTSELRERMISHNQKSTKGRTIRNRPRKPVFTEEFEVKR